MNRDQIDRMIDAHFQYELTDDVEGVLSTLCEDVTHDTPGWPTGPLHGHDQVRPFYETLFRDLADGRVQSLRRLYGEGFAVDESQWTGNAVGRPFGLEGRGRPLEFRLLHVFEFTDEGRIAREAVWVDLAAIQQQLPQGEASESAPTAPGPGVPVDTVSAR